MFYAKIVTGKVDIFTTYTTYVKVFLLMKKKNCKTTFFRQNIENSKENS